MTTPPLPDSLSGGDRTGDEGARASRDPPTAIRGVLDRVLSSIGTAFSVLALILILAVLTAIPLLQFLALGLLLEASGSVARTGRLSDGFPLLDLAPRIGAMALGTWLVLLPIRLLSGALADGWIIAPDAPAVLVVQRLLAGLAILAFVHVSLALARGGFLSAFFRPLKNLRWFLSPEGPLQPAYWERTRGVLEHLRDRLRFRERFWLGVRGFFGSFLFLALPTLVFAASNRTAGKALILTVIGAILLAAALSWMPFLQARFAMENRLGALLEVRRVRELYPRAPLAFAVSTFLVLAPSLPLYFFKIVVPPGDAVWMITIAFVLALYPGKLAAGWALHRALARPRPAHGLFRVLGRLVLLATLLPYTFVLFLTQFVGEHGRGTLFEHHAFLLRVGF